MARSEKRSSDFVLAVCAINSADAQNVLGTTVFLHTDLSVHCTFCVPFACSKHGSKQNYGDDATPCRPTAYVGQRPEELAERQRDAVKAALSAHDAKTLSEEVTARIWMKQRVRKLYLTEAQREEQERADKAIFVHVHGVDTSDSVPSSSYLSLSPLHS